MIDQSLEGKIQKCHTPEITLKMLQKLLNNKCISDGDGRT